MKIVDEYKEDRLYLGRSSWWHRLMVAIFRKTINEVAKTALGRAYSRGIINSFQWYELAGIIDRMLWPERGLQYVPPRQKANGGE